MTRLAASCRLLVVEGRAGDRCHTARPNSAPYAASRDEGSGKITVQDFLEFTSSRVTHDVFNCTTTDENGGLRRSVGADLRAAATKNQEVAVQEHCSHIRTCIFTEVPLDVFNFTTTDENGGLRRSVGADHGTAVSQAVTYLIRETAAGGSRAPARLQSLLLPPRWSAAATFKVAFS